MNTETNFKTVAGYCQVQNEAILFTKRKYDFDALSHPLTKEIINGVLAATFIALFTVYITLKGTTVNPLFLYSYAFIGLALLIKTLLNLKYSRQCEIPKESITEIRFAIGIPALTDNRVFIKFITDGKEQETKITVPFTLKRREMFITIKQIFINQGYNVNN